MAENRKLRELDVPKLKRVGDFALFRNIALREVRFPELEEFGGGFLASNSKLIHLEAPKAPELEKTFREKIKLNLMLIRKLIKTGYIAELDRKYELTNEQIGRAGKYLEELKGKAKEESSETVI